MRSHISKPFVRYTLSFFCFILFGFIPFGFSDDYKERLLATAVKKKIHEKRYWNVLLDYEPGWFNTVESRADIPSAFLAIDGKTNPEEELKATIASFFTPPSYKLHDSDLHPRCRFIARYKWLKELLTIDESRLPAVTCPAYDEWRQRLNVDRIVIVFPAADVKRPASMFGHTLLRIDDSTRTAGNFLNYSVNFAADVNLENTNVIAYSLGGIFGAYDGYFTMYPYHRKLQEYNEIEQRDIWEYELNFSPEEIDRLMTRLWELRFTSYDYFFFKENCSFVLLSLLEAAKPEMRLMEQFTLWTVPIDTIRLLADYPNVIKNVEFRPSRLSRILRMMPTTLSPNELSLFGDMVETPELLGDSRFTKRPTNRKVLLMDFLLDYYLIKNNPNDKKNWRNIVRERAKIPIASVKPTYAPSEDANPIYINKTSKLSVSVGINREEPFFRLGYRPLYRDHFDGLSGLSATNYYRIEFFKMSARASKEFGLVAEELKIIGIGNIGPINAINVPLSYNIDLGLASAKHRGCYTCLVTKASADAGVAQRIAGVVTSLTAGALVREKINDAFSSQFETYGKLGAYGFYRSWNVNLEYVYYHTPLYKKMYYDVFAIGISYHDLTDAAIQIHYENSDLYSELTIEADAYF